MRGKGDLEWPAPLQCPLQWAAKAAAGTAISPAQGSQSSPGGASPARVGRGRRGERVRRAPIIHGVRGRPARVVEAPFCEERAKTGLVAVPAAALAAPGPGLPQRPWTGASATAPGPGLPQRPWTGASATAPGPGLPQRPWTGASATPLDRGFRNAPGPGLPQRPWTGASATPLDRGFRNALDRGFRNAPGPGLPKRPWTGASATPLDRASATPLPRRPRRLFRRRLRRDEPGHVL
jgi:hypothetical protein